MSLYFVLFGEPDLPSLRRLDPDRDWDQFVTGERAWVLQTFLRLQAAGLPVHLADTLPENGIAIFSGKHRRRLLALHRRIRTSALLVAIREDVGSTPFADVELVQNPSQVRAERALFMPLWPQPGLTARDPDRAARIQHVAYKGFIGNLHPSFHDASWTDYLQSRSLQWTADAVHYAGSTSAHDGLSWNDFRTTDLIVAVRPDDDAGHPRKPATKLYNAWLAGTPALLGPELAYRALRRDRLDYIEVRDSREAAAAVEQLRDNPALYTSMVEHGRRRAREFTVDSFVQRWRTLTEEVLPCLAKTSRGTRGVVQPLWLRQAFGRLARLRD